MNRVFRWYVFLALLVVPLSAEEPSRYIKLFEDAYRRASTLRATFIEQYSEGGRVERVESGVAYFRRPGKMRWEYQSPEKNLFLVDGKSAWFYVPADHTVTRVPAKDSSDWRTPLALLAGEMKISRVCARIIFSAKEKPEAAGNVVLACELRGAASAKREQSARQPSFQSSAPAESVFFEVAKDSGALVKVSVRDPGGVGVEFHFANWQLDPPLADALFQFDAPPGVAIVNGELSVPAAVTKP